ncbi:PHP-associated domain-containing protein [Conexibacter sp. DBS9H8]|uniref:PHP-associated domain-containing protein n=1 Tax=Conexibacter sp. DBS9H8 TaxID=2937801 RepID=UPI00200C98DA|nr:PHP-associated domain-containing protein [Conexibacter sp. DBS9H8]
MPDARPLTIAQVSPFTLEAGSDVGDQAAGLARALSARGHRSLLVAPSTNAALVRETRRRLSSDPEGLLAEADGAVVTLAVGEVLAFSPTRRRADSLPLDVSRTVEEVMTTIALDVVHVHEPFAPSTASTALRHSHALNVATFHEPTERVLSTQLARPLSELLLSRLDARLASFVATRDLLARTFPGEYRILAPGVAAPPRPDLAGPRTPTRGPGRPLQIVVVAEEERAALRLILRALRGLPEQGWEATVWSARAVGAPATLSRALRERIAFIGPREASWTETVADADLVVLGSVGHRSAPFVLVHALAAGVPAIVPRLAVYEELIGESRCGIPYEPGDVETLTLRLAGLITDADRRRGLAEAAASAGATLTFDRLATEVEDVYAGLVARRFDRRPRPSAGVRAAIAARELIDVDLHMHTDHSYDCATPVEVLLATARERGLGAIAVTEHNEISGALAAAAAADGIKVIVGEEVKTATEGEVIGLFISEKIERGMTLAETVAEIKRQGGLVYVPHPFDRMHAVPDYRHLLEVLDDVDLIEVFNPRVAIPEFNAEAVRFAAKYRIPAGAGSDAHVPQGLGSVRIRMHDFNGPEEFLESLRGAEVIRTPASLIYVQTLKFLQTKALPEPARRVSRERQLRRVARKS